jgi:hypothetical protein
MISHRSGGLWNDMAKDPQRAIVCDASALHADAASLDTLARMRLAAKRVGLELRIERLPDDLRSLLDFAGLAEALGLEPRREPEQREDALGVQEERHLGDPPA